MCDVIIYTDGSCLRNPGPGGLAVILTCPTKKAEISKGFLLTTNNRMELMGCIIGLRAIKISGCSVLMITDSKYVVDAINKGWLYDWHSKGWRKSSKGKVLNVDLWIELLHLLDQHDVKFKWVRGHSGDLMNERCDFLAKLAAQGPDLAIDEGYKQSYS